MSLEDISDHFKLEIATTLAEMYGDPILNELIKRDQAYSRTGKIEKMIDEVLYLQSARVIRELNQGDMFGEQALIRSGQRTASVRCKDICYMAYLDKEDFDRLYNNIIKGRQDRRIQFLKAIPLFSQLSKHYL